ncbi:hypothetical protein PR048_012641 [Dryococelus australis]|uniref:Uncharacterized protein n=1 Tax=Dryococelus australis TaxID=614101 RepID=A0ABQ9HQ74_9NEOP|nr:hypothetical protein PR048_012641 [Dryococelus australis]
MIFHQQRVLGGKPKGNFSCWYQASKYMMQNYPQVKHAEEQAEREKKRILEIVKELGSKKQKLLEQTKNVDCLIEDEIEVLNRT